MGHIKIMEFWMMLEIARRRTDGERHPPFNVSTSWTYSRSVLPSTGEHKRKPWKLFTAPLPKTVIYTNRFSNAFIFYIILCHPGVYRAGPGRFGSEKVLPFPNPQYHSARSSLVSGLLLHRQVFVVVVVVVEL